MLDFVDEGNTFILNSVDQNLLLVYELNQTAIELLVFFPLLFLFNF